MTSGRWSTDEEENTGWVLPTTNGRRGLVSLYPLSEQWLAELRLPMDLRKAEADRLCAFIKSLVVPEEAK